LAGGTAAACGENWLQRRHQLPEQLPGSIALELQPGDRVRVLTPGGGGYGEPLTNRSSPPCCTNGS
jgi:N-methylhydantoinase B/oxoprolinase/acetone carboxylase alpha subunit